MTTYVQGGMAPATTGYSENVGRDGHRLRVTYRKDDDGTTQIRISQVDGDPTFAWHGLGSLDDRLMTFQQSVEWLAWTTETILAGVLRSNPRRDGTAQGERHEHVRWYRQGRSDRYRDRPSRRG